MKRIIIFGLLSIFLAGCGGDGVSELVSNLQKGSVNKNYKNNQHTIPQISDAQKQEFLDAVNSARADTQNCGSRGVFDPAPPLKWSDELYRAAYEHTQDMAFNGVVSHDGTNTKADWTAKDNKLNQGSHFYERIEANGYKYKMIGENVAGGTHLDTAQKVVDAWLSSDGHCANIMNKNFTEIGMALVKENTKYTHYWSQEFGKR